MSSSMTASTTMIVHRGGTRRTRQELATLPCPEATPTWRPIPHADLVAELIAGLERQGVTVVRDQYCTMGAQAEILMGTLDLQIPGLARPDLAMGLGVRTSNDKSHAIRVIAAARVFVCDNMCFSGSEGAVCLRRKHTSRLDLARTVPPAIELFLDKAGHYSRDIDRMRETRIADGRAKEILLESFIDKAPVLPMRLLKPTHDLYFHSEEQRAMFPDRSLWALEQAYTEIVKSLRPAAQEESGRRIGRLFSTILHGQDAERLRALDLELLPV